jgi:hypothetical protein
MSFLKKITSSLFGGGGRGERQNVHREYVRCSRCGEKIPVEIDLRNELAPQYDESTEGAYYVRKGVVGSGAKRCFQTVEVELYFNSDRQATSRYITGGEFITSDEFYADEEQG